MTTLTSRLQRVFAIGFAAMSLFVAHGGPAWADADGRNGSANRRVLSGAVPVRVATYNIENFSASPGDPQFDAAVAVLQRIGADVVCLQEMNSGVSFVQLAQAAGYPYFYLALPQNALDTVRRPGVISVYPIVNSATHSSITLSGDPDARDITRNFAAVEIAVPGAPQDLAMICNHWQSMFSDADEFRRSIESIRALQVGSNYDSRVIPYFIAGDMNDDLLDPPDTPVEFFQEPAGLPDEFHLGWDIVFPIANGAFLPFEEGEEAQALEVIDAFQLQGGDGTHGSGRRIDYLWRSDAVTFVAAEVYDSQDEDIGGGLAKHGDPLPPETSDIASDHLPVFADVLIPDHVCADLNNDGYVDIDDIFAVIGAWGPCPDPCPPVCFADVTEDCVVDIEDVFAVLADWGPCS